MSYTIVRKIIMNAWNMFKRICIRLFYYWREVEDNWL